jgi:hypothetical protein
MFGKLERSMASPAMAKRRWRTFMDIDVRGDAVLKFVGQDASAFAADRVLKTVMFTDIVGSTNRLSARGDVHWRHQLDIHNSLVGHMLSRYGGVQANHTGDGILALFDAPTRAARCAPELVPALAAHSIPIRVGSHTGECQKRSTEWSGIAVHTGQRGLDERAPRPDPPVDILQQHVERELTDESWQQVVDEAEDGDRAVEPTLPGRIPRQPHLVAEPLRQKARRDHQVEVVERALNWARQLDATHAARRDGP